ncbi:hypothetical protein RHMOL_Rhmol11G0029000 [Rhododendron molle]|uniref:Uncharacterized protein n=1 Tax=Rhododendron molle TaxID=49168 RepID=A0ACC0LN19_RHOML|nr:hypothetical protein RHMOL_Rhmol11G0029000 [Rhododendron molle]
MSRVYVGNLDPRVSERELEDEFRVFGVIRSVWVARRPPGYAFIDFDDRRDAQDAIRELDGKNGWRVELSHNSRGGGGGGGGGRGAGGGGRGRSGGSDLKCYECGEPGVTVLVGGHQNIAVCRRVGAALAGHHHIVDVRSCHMPMEMVSGNAAEAGAELKLAALLDACVIESAAVMRLFRKELCYSRKMKLLLSQKNGQSPPLIMQEKMNHFTAPDRF